MIYRVEVSPNNRAGCKNTECKHAGIKISKGQMRFGSWVEGPEFQSWSWKHWGCVTPKQIANLKKAIENDATELDGYEDLPQDFQEKIRNAVQEGHVADEDWGGDAEMNRAGMNGYRTPASKKAKKEALKDADSPSPSKPPAKKRGHVKDDPGNQGAELDGPARKKRKAPVKHEKVKEEEDGRGSANEAQPAKKGRKKLTKVKAEVDSDAGHEDIVLESPVKKARAPRRAAAARKVKYEDAGSDVDSDALETAPPPPAKKTRAPRRPAAAKKIKEEDVNVNDALGDASDPAAAPSARKMKASRKTAVAKQSNIDEAENNADTNTPQSTAPIREATAARNGEAATSIKPEDSSPTSAGDMPTQPASEVHISTAKTDEEGIETEDVAEDDGRATEVAYKAAKQGNKKPVKKAVNGTEATAAKKAKRKTHRAEDPGVTEKPRRANARVTRSHEH